MRKHEQTPKEHIVGNLEYAADQSHEYDETPDWREGDAYMQNVYDSMIEDGYTPEEAVDASEGFFHDAKKHGIRFA